MTCYNLYLSEMEILTGSSGPDRSLLCFDGWVTFNQLDCKLHGGHGPGCKIDKQ